MTFTYRLANPSDLESIRMLWIQNTSWGDYAGPLFTHYVENSPLHGALVTLAVEPHSEEIIGQFVYIPAEVQIDARRVKAYRPAAPILSRQHRRFFGLSPANHPIIGMTSYAQRIMLERGASLTYSLPNPQWVPFIGRHPDVQIGEFPLYSLSLGTDPERAIPDDVEVGVADPADPRIDVLWKAFASYNRCGVVRSSAYLPWKLGIFSDAKLAVTRGDELLAFVSLHRKGNRQLLINDLLYADSHEALGYALRAALHHADVLRQQAGKQDLHKLSILATPAMLPVLEEFGFIRDEFVFHLAVQPLDPSLSKHSIAPMHWHLSAND